MGKIAYSYHTKCKEYEGNGKVDLQSLIFSYLSHMTQVGSQRSAGVWNRSMSTRFYPGAQPVAITAESGLLYRVQLFQIPFPYSDVFLRTAFLSSSPGHGFGSSKMSRAQTFPSYAAEQSEEAQPPLSRSSSYGFSYSSSLIQ
ncbi:hypothetical protein ACRRTK_021045 [Alexandromys fortis]